MATALTPSASSERLLPWEVQVGPEDGAKFVALTFAVCVALQAAARCAALLFVGRKSPTRGTAARIAVKCVSVVFDCVALAGGLKTLVAPDQAVLNDPVYGFSSHSQFHFSVAAGYFAWAAVVTLVYRGSKISLAHHVACSLVYLLTLRPFLHYIGNLFLLFQASTLLIDLNSLSKVLQWPAIVSDRLRTAHSIVFFVIRLGVGLPLSAFWIQDMMGLLESGLVHSTSSVFFMLGVNAIINFLNLYWGFGMLVGLESKNNCSPGVHPAPPTQYFDLGSSISFGVRDKPHRQGRVEKALGKLLLAVDQVVSVNMFLLSVVIGVLGIIAGVDQFAMQRLGVNSADGSKAPVLLGVSVLAGLYLALQLFERFGALVFPEASLPAKKGVRGAQRTKPLYSKIRGKWYELSKFDHPGGPVALALAEGRDATALFESHHYLMDHTRLHQVLSKYEVAPEVAKTLKTLDPRDDGAHYDWDLYDKDPFTQDMRKMIQDHFRPEAERRGISLRQATKATPRRWLWIVSLMVSFFATLPSYFAGQWWTLLATPLLAWMTIANYWHDGLHFSLSTDWRINAMLPYLFPWLSSPWMWYHQHCIGHHCYTNVAHKDPDLAHAPQLMREHNSIRWRPAHATQESASRVVLIWSIAVGLGLQVLSDVRANLKGSYNNVVPYKLLEPARLYAHTAGRLFYAASLFIWPFACLPLHKAFIWATVPIALFSWYFMLNSQINHLTEECAHAEDKHFLKHQIITAQDFGDNRLFPFLFSGGLNMQIEHHMFPCVNHCHLPALRPKVMELCKKHNVPYHSVSGYQAALNKHLEHTEKMGLRPFSVGHEH